MDILELAGAVIGLVYLWLEYKASIYLWIAGVIMPAIYLVVYYRAGLYADFGINIYYLIIALYGWGMWKYGNKPSEKKELPITATPLKSLPRMMLTFVTSFIVIALILIRFTDSDVPWLDSFTTALSFIGMWMLARKYLEQWLVWIVVDVVCCGLYIYKELYFTSILYGLYAIIAIFGYYKWKKMMHTC